MTLNKCMIWCVIIFRKSDEKIVPFRDSKLTKLLQPYFVGKGRGTREGRVVMVLNVSDIGSVFDETSHVLKFSALASKVHCVCTCTCMYVCM